MIIFRSIESFHLVRTVTHNSLSHT